MRPLRFLREEFFSKRRGEGDPHSAHMDRAVHPGFARGNVGRESQPEFAVLLLGERICPDRRRENRGKMVGDPARARIHAVGLYRHTEKEMVVENPCREGAIALMD